MKLSDGKLKRMKSLANERGIIAAVAMDQRGNLQKALATGRGVAVTEITPEIMTEFKVAVSRILTPQAGTEAITRVMIESADKTGERWSTVGVSGNIIDASYEALDDAITWKLLKSRGN